MNMAEKAVSIERGRKRLLTDRVLYRLSLLSGVGIEKRIFLLIGIILVPILVFQAYTLYTAYENRRDHELQANLEVAGSLSNSFEAFVNGVLHQEFIIGKVATSLSPSYKDLKDLLRATAKDYPSIRHFSWLSPEGRILNSSLQTIEGMDASDRQYFRKINAGDDWAVSDLFRSITGNGLPIFAVSRGIRDERGRLLGVVVATIDPDKLDYALAIERTDEGSISLSDSRGALVYHYPHINLSWESRYRSGSMPEIKKGAAGRSFAADPAYDAEPEIIGNVPIKLSGWSAQAARTREEAMEPVYTGLFEQVIFFSLIATLSLWAALAIARTISLPLRRLRNHALILGRGDFEKRIEPEGPSELREFATTFNNMAHQVQSWKQNTEKRTAQLEAANAELEGFSYTVSHDLRAPLRAIEGFSGMLLKDMEGRMDSECVRKFQVITSNTQKMGRLIDDLLRLSRTGRVNMSISGIDMESLIKDVWTEIQSGNPDRDIDFRTGDLPSISGDKTLIRQVISNLLGNAVKFTRNTEHAVIEVKGFRTGNLVTYCVKDNGIGFDMKYQEKLFELFRRLHSEREFEGTGAGLAIVKKIIDRHQGTIWAESAPGMGATFYFRIPV